MLPAHAFFSQDREKILYLLYKVQNYVTLCNLGAHHWMDGTVTRNAALTFSEARACLLPMLRRAVTGVHHKAHVKYTETKTTSQEDYLEDKSPLPSQTVGTCPSWSVGKKAQAKS